MDPEELDYEWDPTKERSNRRKHGVGFIEAATVLLDPLSLTLEEMRNSADETRYRTVGMSKRLRVLVVVWTHRETAIRLISARLATRHEIRRYEEEA